MSRHRTEQERIDNLTMQIENTNMVGSGFVRYPPQRPVLEKVPHRQAHPASQRYLGGGGGGRHGQQARQVGHMNRGMANPGPQMQSLHHFNPPAPHQRLLHQHHNGHGMAGGMGHHGPGFSPRGPGPQPGYRPHNMDQHLQGGMYGHQMGPGGPAGYHPEGGPPFQNGMGMMGRGMAGGGLVQQGLGGGAAPRPGYPLPHQLAHHQPLPQQAGLPLGGYLEQGTEQGLQPGFVSRGMDAGLVNRPKQYQPQAPGYLPAAHPPASSAHLVQQFGGENGQQHMIAQQQQQSVQHVRVPQLSVRPPAIEDGSRSPAVNYQPPPPHKAPAPIGTPLPGSLATKASPPKAAPGKSGLGVPSVRPSQAPHPTSQAASQLAHRHGPGKPAQQAPSRPTQSLPAASVAPRPRVVEAPVHQAPKGVASLDSEEEVGDCGDSLNGDGKEALTKRQKTRLRKKLREQHLKKQPVPNVVGGV